MVELLPNIHQHHTKQATDRQMDKSATTAHSTTLSKLLFFSCALVVNSGHIVLLCSGTLVGYSTYTCTNICLYVHMYTHNHTYVYLNMCY